MLKNSVCSPNISIKEALKKIELSGLRCIYIEKNNRLVGSLTDGDIRELILKNINLEKKVEKFFNKKPKFLEKKLFTINEAKKIFFKYKIDSLPLTNNKKIIEIITLQDIVKNKFTNQKNSIIIMAGGKGERLLPFTSILPKPLIPINGTPIIKLIINSFALDKVKEIFVSVNYKSLILKSYLKSEIKDRKIIFITEPKPLGTIGALKLVDQKKLSDDIIITFCDIFFQKNMDNVLNFHKKNHNDLTIVVAKKKIQIPYGVCKLSRTGNFIKISEKPINECFVNVGYYIIKKKMLKYIIKGKRLDITDLIKKIKSGKNKIKTYPINENTWHDVGQWANYKDALNSLKTL